MKNSTDWFDIPGYSGYQINTDGEVRIVYPENCKTRVKPKILKQRTWKRFDNQVTVRLKNKNGNHQRVLVSSLMRDTFLGGSRNGLVVYHRDGNILNNALYNLGFETRSQLGKGSGNHTRKPVLKVSGDGEIVEMYRSMKDATTREYCSDWTMRRACNGHRTVLDETGYTFMFADDF